LDDEELLQCARDREVGIHGRVAAVARGVLRQGLAVVVVEFDQEGATCQRDEDDQADREMNLWLARDLDPGPPPEPAGHVLAGLDPTSSSGKHDQRGQHRDRRKEADNDGDRQGRTDGLEDAESGEGETEERDGDRACGAGDHRADEPRRRPRHRRTFIPVANTS
jgi:hypothetical protein